MEIYKNYLTIMEEDSILMMFAVLSIEILTVNFNLNKTKRDKM